MPARKKAPHAGKGKNESKTALSVNFIDFIPLKLVNPGILRKVMKNNKPFAEVIESSLTCWVAQSWQWNTFPSFGSLLSVQAKQRTLFGLVCHIQTGSMDPSRSPFPYQKTEEELMAEQPQIFEFLKTSFNCIIIGYQEHGKIYYLLPPQPAQIHSFVQEASADQGAALLANEGYLHLLFSSCQQLYNPDELLLALLRYQSANNLLTPDQLKNIIQKFSLLIGNDYRRLKLLASRIEQNVINHI